LDAWGWEKTWLGQFGPKRPGTWVGRNGPKGQLQWEIEKMETGRTREWAQIIKGLLKSFSDLNQGFEFIDSKIQILSD
jgi:hypothetical protein